MQTCLNYYLDGAIDISSKASDIFYGIHSNILCVFVFVIVFVVIKRLSGAYHTLERYWVAKLQGQQNVLFFELTSLLRKLGYVYM